MEVVMQMLLSIRKGQAIILTLKPLSTHQAERVVRAE